MKVWFKNKRAKCRQIQKQGPGKVNEAPTNLSKKTTNATTSTKLKAKPSTSLLNNSATTSLLAETSNFIKAQNPFLIPTSGQSKVKIPEIDSEKHVRIYKDLVSQIYTSSSSSPLNNTLMNPQNHSIWSPAHIEVLPDVQRFHGHHSMSPPIESQKYPPITSHHHASPNHYGYSSVCYSNVDYLSGHQQNVSRLLSPITFLSYNHFFQEPEASWTLKPRDDSWLYNSHWENIKK